jgi:hypothetical protein
MKRTIASVVPAIFVAFLGLPALGADGTATTPAAGGAGPRIQFESPTYDFGRAKAGEPVRYTYVFTNTGDQLLEVTEVRPGCGCTTAGDWTRKVEPGKTGTAPIQFNTGNFNGPVLKTINVTCNDPRSTHLTLQLKGTVWRAIEVIPQYAYINNVVADSEPGMITVRILNNEDEPLDVFPPQTSNHSLSAELKTVQPGKEYQVVISTISPLKAGSLQAQVTLKTSSRSTPLISIPVMANVQPSIAVNPGRISLPVAPLANQQSYTVSIINNAKDSLALTEPGINASGVNVQLTEKQPGRAFAAVVTFPQGFEIARGEDVELSIKSSNPGKPVIKVPVQQLPRPTAPLVVPIKPQAASPQASNH